MHHLLNIAFADFVILLSIVSIVGNPSLGAYLLFQFVVAPKRKISRRHWAGFWAAGWLFLLCGLPTIFIGGIFLIIVSTGLWAYAAWRCGQEQPKPPIKVEGGEPSKDAWPPPPTSAALYNNDVSR